MSAFIAAGATVAAIAIWWVHRRQVYMLTRALDYQRGRTQQLSMILVDQYRRGSR